MADAPFLIAVAAPPGGGKTALMLALADRLAGACWLSMDGFAAPAAMAPEALERWLDEGADFARLEVPGFAEALAALKAGRPAVEPETGRRVSPAPLILAEAPLGRAHGASASLIDALVWIDVPLDVALARNVLAWEAAPEPRPAGWLAGYMAHYLSITRRVLMAQQRAIAPQADVAVDGLLGPAAQAEQVVRALGLDRQG